MYFEYDEQEGYTVVSAELEDKCVMCKYFDECPLIGAIETHLVYPSASSLYVEECPMYELELGEINSLN